LKKITLLKTPLITLITVAKMILDWELTMFRPTPEPLFCRSKQQNASPNKADTVPLARRKREISTSSLKICIGKSLKNQSFVKNNIKIEGNKAIIRFDNKTKTATTITADKIVLVPQSLESISIRKTEYLAAQFHYAP
jgi:hypothetical protein